MALLLGWGVSSRTVWPTRPRARSASWPCQPPVGCDGRGGECRGRGPTLRSVKQYARLLAQRVNSSGAAARSRTPRADPSARNSPAMNLTVSAGPTVTEIPTDARRPCVGYGSGAFAHVAAVNSVWLRCSNGLGRYGWRGPVLNPFDHYPAAGMQSLVELPHHVEDRLGTTVGRLLKGNRRRPELAQA